VRIVIAEDLTLLREGLTRLLRDRGWEIVAAVDNGPALVDAIVEHRPDLALVDVRLPPSFTDEGVRAAIEARERVPGTPVLILSQYVEESYAGDLLASEEGGVGSRTASPMCASSPSRSSAWPTGARRWTRRSSPSCSAGATTAARSRS
jgi:DNA-binding NarL/FixJ family response regulator